jgi:hypothetical protein
MKNNLSKNYIDLTINKIDDLLVYLQERLRSKRSVPGIPVIL